MPASVKHGSWILNQLERRLRERARKGREVQESNWQVMKAGIKKKLPGESLKCFYKKNAKEKLDQNDSFGVFIWASAAAWALLLFVFELLFTFPVNDLQKELSKKCAQTNLSHYCVSHLLSFLLTFECQHFTLSTFFQSGVHHSTRQPYKTQPNSPQYWHNKTFVSH